MNRLVGRKPDRRGWRLARSVALLVYAALAGASGADRLASTNFAAERAAPGMFRVAADARTADRLIEAGIPESALAPAQRLVARDPLGTSSVALLGAALLGQGEAARADRAFRLAARRGWRDPRTQLYWLRVALTQGEYRLAALRFGALARQWPNAPAIGQVAAAFEASPQGRLALAERIAAGDRWAAAYAQPSEAVAVTALSGRAEVLLLVPALGAQLGCAAIAPLVGRLIENDPLRAAKLWHGHCAGAGAPGSLTDTSFAQASFAAPGGPLAWEFPGDGALQLGFIASRAQRSLQVTNSGPLTIAFAAQRVVLGPGRYRLRVTGGPANGPVLASLSCRRELMNAVPVSIRAGGAELAFAGTCAAPWLQLWLAPGSGPVVLDSVELTPR